MLYRFFNYLKFIFSATNQHGIHSPFIYAFVTKCLYIKSKIKGPKITGILFKCILYFNATHMNIIPKNIHLEKRIKNEFPKIEFNKHPFDIIYLEYPNPELFDNIIRDNNYHNDSILLIRSIHKNRESTMNWELFKNSEEVTVSVDMYYGGALFFRKEQVKEHFKIRI